MDLKKKKKQEWLRPKLRQQKIWEKKILFFRRESIKVEMQTMSPNCF